MMITSIAGEQSYKIMTNKLMMHREQLRMVIQIGRHGTEKMQLHKRLDRGSLRTIVERPSNVLRARSRMTASSCTERHKIAFSREGVKTSTHCQSDGIMALPFVWG